MYNLDPITHIHDCDECLYLGEFFDYQRNRIYDLYFHEYEFEASVYTELIARYSSDEQDYLATGIDPESRISDPALATAHARYTLHLIANR